MNRRKKQIELMKQSVYLRSLKFNDSFKKQDEKKVNEIVKLQDNLYKRFAFYKGINEALARR